MMGFFMWVGNEGLIGDEYLAAEKAWEHQQERIDELEQQLAELEAEVRDKVEGMLERGAEIRELRKQLAALRGAVQTMRERVRERNGSLIVVGAEEYDALTALLEVKK